MVERSEVLMRHGVSAPCADCGDERVFEPVEGPDADTFCCTACDAAVFGLPVRLRRPRRDHPARGSRRVA